MRLIDADALIPMMKYATTDSEIGVFPIKIGFNDIEKVINEQPTVNTAETDLISRQAAIEIIQSYYGQMPNEVNHRIWKEINELPSARPEKRWIPCSERLPEKEGWYITTVESEKTGKRRIENDLFAVDIALAHGHTPNKFCKDGYRQRTVAWMPFPEPYTER